VDASRTADYAGFLAAKTLRTAATGPLVADSDVHPFLHPWQRDIVRWAVRTGCAAIWADTGLGKTVMQLEWARLSGRRVLVLAPLAVCHQTVREGAKIGLSPRYLREDDGQPGIVVTNYEISGHFDASRFDAVVLDESSVIKDVTTKTRDRLIEQFRETPRRLDCSATPAPNDLAELANHAEFLGVSTRREMLSSYFVHDQDGWRVKGHARGPMFRWMATWALAIRRPSDLGYPDGAYQLPALDIRSDFLPVDVVPEGQLFATDLGGVGGRARVRRATMSARCARAVDLISAEPDEPWIAWCGLNDEAREITRAIPGAVNVEGSQSPEDKAAAFLAFADGSIRVLITKPDIAARGLNWQHCARMTFVGLSDSYEAYYQAIRRCWRYGQDRPVTAHVILSTLESQIAANVRRKESEAARLTDALIREMQAANAWSAA
jgi:hypothetical protein